MRRFLRLLRLLNRPCRDISLLASESLDRHLPWPERWAVRVHTVYCTACRRYRRQILQLRRMMGSLDAMAAGLPSMSAEQREGIRRTLRRREG